MTHTRTSRRVGALTLALVVAATTALASVASPAFAGESGEEDPAWKALIDVAPDYLVDTYGLPADHVFETVTFERFEWLLGGRYEDNTTEVTGTFAFLVGGAYDESITSTIGYIDEVAKQFGVETVYTFDPALDGNTLNIWDTSELSLHEQGKAQYEALGDRLLDSYLNQDTNPEFDGSSSDPYLFIYDKTRTVDVEGVPTEDRIVASLDVRKTQADFEEPGAAEAYKAQVASVFDAVAVEGVAQLDTLDQGEFWKAETNRRHRLQYTNPASFGETIIEDEDLEDGWRIQTITYPELLHLLEQEGDYLIFLGGTWCHNTRAVIKQVNAQAQRLGVKTIYNFDNSLDSTGNAGNNYRHIRDNAAAFGDPPLPRRPSYLYGDVWNNYFPNIVTQYRISQDEGWAGQVNPVQFHPGGDHTQPLQLARKGQVPFLFHYNKDNIAGSEPAPVVSQWIRTNGPDTNPTSGHTEYMISWFHTPTSGPLSGNAQAQAFAAAAEEALETFFDQLPGAFEETTVSVTAENAGGGAVTLTATVFWCGSIAPDATGTVEFFRVEEGGDVSLGSTSSFEDGQVFFTVSNWGQGVREYYVVYTPSAGSAYDVAESPIEIFSIDPVATTLAASGSAAVGTATLTATVLVDSEVATHAAGTVEFFDDGPDPAVSLGTATVSDGVASVTLTDAAPGDLVFYASYTPAGDSIYLASISPNATVTVPDVDQTSVCDTHQGGSSFPDAPGSGHQYFIDCLASLGIVGGFGDGTFGPRLPVTRGQLASFVVRAIEEATQQPLEAGGELFTDVSPGSTHGQAIYKLRNAGIILGYPDGTFRPGANVSRDQTARYVANTLELVLEETLPTSGARFPDVTSTQFVDDIDKLVTAGIIGGFGDGTFGPRLPVTRGQTARFIGNSLEHLKSNGAYHGA